MATQSIGISFPFKNTTAGGVFGTDNSTESALKSDLISLLTLKRGQRPMQSNMYSPAFDYINEQFDSIMTQRLQNDLTQKINEYLPQLQIQSMVFTAPADNFNMLGINIKFSITQLFGAVQSVNINIPVTTAS